MCSYVTIRLESEADRPSPPVWTCQALIGEISDDLCVNLPRECYKADHCLDSRSIISQCESITKGTPALNSASLGL
jgi:hypothetical protein